MDKTYNEFDEEKLLLLLKNSDSKAFSTLYHLHIKPLRHYLLKLAKSPVLADDIIHDTFIKVWESRTIVNPNLQFRPLLFTIAKRLLINLFKRAQHEQLILNEIKKYAIPLHNVTEETIYYNESHLLLNEAINQLPNQCRQVFIKCKLEGSSYREISAELGIAESTINNQMVKALKSIKKYLSIRNSAVLFFIILFKIF